MEARGSRVGFVGVGVGGGGGLRGFLSAKISQSFFKSMGLMQSYKKGKLIHTVSGVI